MSKIIAIFVISITILLGCTNKLNNDIFSSEALSTRIAFERRSDLDRSPVVIEGYLVSGYGGQKHLFISGTLNDKESCLDMHGVPKVWLRNARIPKDQLTKHIGKIVKITGIFQNEKSDFMNINEPDDAFKFCNGPIEGAKIISMR